MDTIQHSSNLDRDGTMWVDGWMVVVITMMTTMECRGEIAHHLAEQGVHPRSVSHDACCPVRGHAHTTTPL